ncbi:transcriptional regulator FtsR [Microbacterium sp. gxy059]|uniref:transcriptional regulator FtsR n=1 Tax=Microbacterium sp. gxy059 TaxID=2957199 RepID=UPI003D95CEC4
MAGASAGGAATPAGSRLSIGQVLSKLTGDFPALTSSKLRFLEVQGIVSPERTSSGYRKFSSSDVERLRLALTLQRDHYLPLSVIREHLDQLDEGDSPGPPEIPASIHPRGRSLSRAELLSETSASPRLLDEALALGLLSPAERYDDAALSLLRSLVALERHGIDPRHVRAMRQSAEREAALVEAALGPLLRRSDPASRARASELAPELAARLDEVRAQFVREALDRILSS